MKFASLKNSIEESIFNNNINKYNVITISIFLELSNVVEYMYTLIPRRMYSIGYIILNIV